MESHVVFIQYQSFQFYSLLWNNGEKTSTRFRRRTSHSKIATNDEPYCKGAVERVILDFSKPGEEKLWKSKSLEYECWGRGRIGETRYRQRPKDRIRLLLSWAIYGKFLLSKLLKVSWWPCLVFSWVENWYWDVRETGEKQCNFLGSDTRNPIWFLSRDNSSWWNRAIRCEWGNASWKIGATWYPILEKRHGLNNFFISNDETELELSVESRSFVNKVNDQVRKRQKRISSVAEDGEKHSMIWRMFVTVTMESAVWMGKNYLNNCQSIANTTDYTPKQMFDISTKLVSEQDEIKGLETIGWEYHSWKYLSLIGDERVINLRRTKVYVFSDSVLCLGKIFQKTPTRTMHGNKDWDG